MKGYTNYMQTAITSQFMNYFDGRDFAEAVVIQLNDYLPDEEISIQEANRNGMILRVKRDSVVDMKTIRKSVISAMKAMIDDDGEDFGIRLLEQYEISYEHSMINQDLLDNTIDIKKRPREIYIEVDI